jgi:hypothetical protein
MRTVSQRIPLFVLVVVPIFLFIYLLIYGFTPFAPFSFKINISQPPSNTTISHLTKIHGSAINQSDLFASGMFPGLDIPVVAHIQYYPYALVVSGITNSFLMYGKHTAPYHHIDVITWTARAYDISLVLPIFLIICLIYGFYPLRYHGDEYFERKGFVAAITEYRLVKKILYIEIPLLILFAAMFYADFGYLGLFRLSFALQVALQYSVTAGTLWLLSHSLRKEFRYYLARAYVKTIPDNGDIEKMNWLIMALKMYNKYLLRNLKLQIDDTKLYSTLIIEPKVQISDMVKLISESFSDNDKLTPARRLSEIMKVQKIEEFLGKPSIREIVITWGTLAGVILPVVISILQLSFHLK